MSIAYAASADLAITCFVFSITKKRGLWCHPGQRQNPIILIKFVPAVGFGLCATVVLFRYFDCVKRQCERGQGANLALLSSHRDSWLDGSGICVAAHDCASIPER